MDNKKSLDNALDLLGTKWNLPIVLALLGKKSRFNEIQRECNVCPRTLSARLDELEKNQIIKKNTDKNNALKIEYSLTKKGEALSSVISSIDKWAANS